MLIRRIAVTDFRKLGRATVEGLSDGLNVIVGDNEAGKSTLLAALRAGLFERHRVGGEVALAMQPYGQTVRPEVTVDFEIAGRSWRLRKAFCQRPEAELSTPGERIAGDAVEERLATLFGFTPPGRGGSKPEEHQGVHGLLWVEQGRSHRGLGVGAGKDVLASALETEVGQLVGGERGRALLAAAEERRGAAWDKRDKPRGPFKASGEEVERLEAEHARLSGEIDGLDRKITELAAKTEALARHEREGHAEAAARALDAARLAAGASERLATAFAAADERAARLRADHDAAVARVAARAVLATAAADCVTVAGRAEAALGEAQDVLARRDKALRGAEETAREAQERRRASVEALRALDRARDAANLRVLEASLAERLTAAEKVEFERRAGAALAASVTVSPSALAALDALVRERDAARLGLEAASVRILFQGEPGRTVAVDGTAHDTAVPLTVARDAVLDLGGFGRLVVKPGGGTEALASRAEAADRALADRLAALGHEDIASVRAALTAKADAGRDAERAAASLKLLAPQGLPALAQALADARALLQAAEPRPAPDAGALAEAARRNDEADGAARGADLILADARRARAEADRLCATLAERLSGARREMAANAQLLDRSRVDQPDALLHQREAESAAALAAAEARRDDARRALAAADPEAASLELKRAGGAEKAIRLDIETLRRDKRDLEVELRTLGERGLGEALAETGERLEAARRAHAGHAAEARAARLLHETLAQAQRETRDRWLGPVRERAAPYLRLVQPDSEVVLDEGTLEIQGLVRRGVPEPFAGLSMGAREQVAVITRLALADILRGAEKPSAVILDDALVNADEDRLRRMHLVLQRAGQTMQVIVLTCRERDFMGLGAPIHRL